MVSCRLYFKILFFFPSLNTNRERERGREGGLYLAQESRWRSLFCFPFLRSKRIAETLSRSFGVLVVTRSLQNPRFVDWNKSIDFFRTQNPWTQILQRRTSSWILKIIKLAKKNLKPGRIKQKACAKFKPSHSRPINTLIPTEMVLEAKVLSFTLPIAGK